MRSNTAFTWWNMPLENQDQTLPVLCRICPLKIKTYMYPFLMRKDTGFTFQNMPYENQDFYVPFCYQSGHCLYVAEYAL